MSADATTPTPAPTRPAPGRSGRARLVWSAVVAALSAAAWLAWLSWADDQPDLTTWQVAGVLATLLGAVVVGVLRVGPGRTWLLASVPFAALGAYSLIGSDPLGAVGAVVWVLLSAVVVAVLTGLVWGAHSIVHARRRGGGQAVEPSPPVTSSHR